MLKKWQKFESFLNRKLEALLVKTKTLVLGLIPGAVFQLKNKIVIFFIDCYIFLKARAINTFIESKDWVIYRKDRTFTVLTNLQSYPIQEKIQKLFQTLFGILRIPPKQYIKKISTYFVYLFDKIDLFFKRFSGSQIMVTAIAITLFIFGTNLLFKSSKFIWLSENPSRAPASIEEKLKRPDYYNLNKKTFVVLNIRVPIFTKDRNQVTAVTIDFGVKTSNRFATLFLTEYEYKLKDHFFMTMHPIESSFPLQEEGKNVIKEKIQYELNEFLKSENVEGEVEEVTIMYIIAT